MILLQEELLGQPYYPWKMLVACFLLDRCREEVVRPVLAAVLKSWPAPARLASADEKKLALVLRPLGLQSTRARRLIEMSRRFWSTEELGVESIPGVGSYALDSWRIFVEGRRDVHPQDRKLQAFLSDPSLRIRDAALHVMLSARGEPRSTTVDELAGDFIRLSKGKSTIASWRVTLRKAISVGGNISLYRCARVMGEKNYLYGSEHIKLTGTVGIAIRNVDKAYRLMRLEKLRDGGARASRMDESAEDTRMDMINYCVLAVLLLEGGL